MSAGESLQPRQFGPGGKYTSTPHGMFGPETNPKYVTAVEATHTNSGRRIGYLSWFKADGNRHPQGSPDPDKPAIYKTVVSKPLRRKGIATELLNHAREIAPGLQHSGPQALTEDGAAWARSRP